MPRRVNPPILLGLVIVTIISFGLSAAAQTEDSAVPKENNEQGKDPSLKGKDAVPDGDAALGGDALPRENAGSETGDAPKDEVGLSQTGAEGEADPLGTLERKQVEADEAYWEHKRALSEERQVNDEIVQTNETRTKTEEQLANAEKQLGDRASEIYKYGNRGFLDALIGANNLQEAAQVFDLWTRQLGQDRGQVEELRKNRDALDQQEKILKAQVEERKQILGETEAKQNEAQRARDDAQEFVDSLSVEDRENIEETKAEQNRDATEAIRQMLDAQGQQGESGEVSDSQGQPSVEEPGNETSTEQVKPMTEDDRARQTKMAEVIDQTLQELSAQGLLPKKEGTDEPARNAIENGGNQNQNNLAEMATDIANKREQADQQARDAAEKVTAEQEAADKAAKQTQAAEDAKRAAQQAPPEEQARLQSAADEAQRLADQTAQEATQQKLAAQEATDKAARDKAALPSADPTTGTSGSQPALSGSGSAVLDVADGWLGVPYKAGGDSRAGIDCSAFTKAVYEKFGIELPDSPAGQMTMGTPVSQSELKPGDLVFFDENGGGGPPTHVGIYMGNGMIIHASDYFRDVAESKMDYIKGFIGGRRLL